MVTYVIIVNIYLDFTFITFYLFTKGKCFIFVKNGDYEGKIPKIDEI